MVTHYVRKKPVSELLDDNENLITQLLWGDPIHVLDDSNSTWSYVRARGTRGWVRKSHLRKATSSYHGLLEIYIIDVGQGDGVLFKTPDGKWHLVDAGVPNSRQMTRKGAANFLRWKFYEDLRAGKISLSTITASHPDYDHYGGMIDVLGETLEDGRTFRVEVDRFYHSGMGRFAASSDLELGTIEQGRVGPFPQGAHGIGRSGRFITQLLDDLDSFDNPPRPLSTSFKQLADLVVQKCGGAKALSRSDRHLPGYAPGDTDVTIHVLAPIVENIGQGRRGLRAFEAGRWWQSKTRNGHSITYRLDYGDARLLLTGDLNTLSQRLLLSYVQGEEFAADVAKGCHHGSEDILMDFVKEMKARATVISSGDNESYAHPRPIVMGASAKYGRESEAADGSTQAPLLYSTELARSVALAYPSSVKLDPDFSGPLPKRWYSAKTTEIKSSGSPYRPLKTTPIATNLIYGLVNVRTDGETILCGTMLESGREFDVKTFRAGRGPDDD